MKKLIVLLFIMLTPMLAMAQEIPKIIAQPESVEGLSVFLPAIITAYQSSNWLILGALLAMVVTFLVKKYVLKKLKLGTGILPIISAMVGIVGGVGLAVISGATPQEASMAVLSGPLASTLWASGAKYFFKK